ncbi:MAG: FHA domain-containing protein, partial [Azonexus sp.]|nr:FHA domain-containing protein [Azonexus sp.]
SRLCLRYLGQTYLVSSQNPVLTTGRDASCGVIVDDRRVSRQHARIERRSDGFYLVDTSTNGSFVSIQGRQEALVRKHDVLLEGRGKICLGSTINDGRSECLEFEHL